MTFKFTADQEAWLHDLETTDAPQCEGKLYIVGGGFCCLGRACQVLLGDPDAFCGSGKYKLGLWDGDCFAHLPTSMVGRLHLYGSRGTINQRKLNEGGEKLLEGLASKLCLTDLNDHLNWDFRRIAAFIRANPEAVFERGAEE